MVMKKNRRGLVTQPSMRVPGPTILEEVGEEEEEEEEIESLPLPRLHPTHVPYRLAAAHVLSRLESRGIAPPTVGIICGSGLSGLSGALDEGNQIKIPYTSIPGFPKVSTTVAGHAGELVVGTLHSIPAICFRGRFHSYEGHDMNTVALPVRVMRCLGVKLVLVTNAAGGLKDAYKVGDVAIIRDHIAIPLLAGKNPLVGPNDDELGPRFPPTSNLYDSALQDVVVDVAGELDFDRYLHCDGTYAFVSGPQYESKSECAMLRLLGADAVGMSTVPEILAAHHAGMGVLCLSLITNKVVYFDEPAEGGNGEGAGHANHEEVLEAVKGRGEQLVHLVGEVVKRLGEDYLPKMKEMEPICLETEGRVEGSEEAEEGRGRKEDKKCDGFSLANHLCPYHMVKNILNTPVHCLVLGGAILALGAVLGMKVGKRV